MKQEYQEIQEKFQSLSKTDFLTYLKEQGYAEYDYFEVDDNTLFILENGYVTDDSGVDALEKTSRIAEYSGAEFDLSELTGDFEKDYNIIDAIIGETEQYIEDVTDAELYDRIYETLEEGAKITDYYNFNQQPGKYIWIQK